MAKPSAGQRVAVDNGPRGQSIGRCGVSHGVLVSALQKYIRRCEVDKAVRCALELDRFCEIAGATGRAITSNMINRVAIIAMEDIGPANPSLLPWIEERRAAWKSKRESKERLPELIAVVRAMANSHKSRLASHARSAFCFEGDAVDVAAQAGIKKPKERGFDLLAASPGESLAVTRLEEMLGGSLADTEDEAIYWAGELAKKTLGVPRNRSKKGIAAVWESLLQAATIADLGAPVSALYAWHMELLGCREDFCFAVCAILVLNRYNSIPEEWGLACEVNVVTQAEADGLYAECPELKIDDYCIDKHTAEGRRAGKDTVTFVREGAVVERQAPWAFEPTYYDVYMALRDPPKESTLFLSPVRCQLVTSDAKTCTYLAKSAKDGECLFVKGPMDRGRAIAQVAIDKLKGKLSGMNSVGYWRARAVPDHFPGTPLGLRKKLREVSQFLVSRDLIHANGYDELPTVVRESKVWKNTPVYDRDADAKATAAHGDLEHPNYQLLTALSFRYVFGIGDTCNRNFIRTTPYDSVFSVDEESMLGKYAPPRYGEAKVRDIINRSAMAWAITAKNVLKWPDELAALPGEQIKIVLRFAAPRIVKLLENGPLALYTS